MRPDLILAHLRKDPRNHITAFHRNLFSTGGEGRALSGGATAGITLNVHEPFFDGWAESMTNSAIYIHYADIWPIKKYLNEERWGNETIGGTLYKLRADIDSTEFTWLCDRPQQAQITIPSANDSYRCKISGMLITIESVKLSNGKPVSIICQREDGLRFCELSWNRFKSEFSAAQG
ncbi:hypothetical protein [Serratia proteamaculans]|jgi:hypothetical protein